MGQLETIQELYDISEVTELIKKYDSLGAKIYTFTLYVEKSWKT
jgi:hypothetical protein